MNRYTSYCLKIVMLSVLFITSNAFKIGRDEPNKVRVLLMGDSTTEGGKQVFETSVEDIINSQEDLPSVEVINVGLGGETAHSLINSGRYEKDIKPIENIDYIFFRYGINDWFKRQPFDENFPKDMKVALDQIQADFPEAKLILMSIIPFLNKDASKTVNDHIVKIAKERGLDLFDIYPLYKEQVDKLGPNSLSIRFFPLSDIPKIYHELVKPYTRYYAWKDAEWVRVQSGELDPLFGDLPNWYRDKHPNTAGYRYLADETARYLESEFQK